MKCEQYEQLFAGWANGDLTPAERKEMEQHLAGCAGCREELADMQKVWDMMEVIETPEPSAHMQVKFQAMLDTYKESVQEQKGLLSRLNDKISSLWQPRWALAYSMAIILVSFGA